jgi:hypothetical protein
MTWNIASPPPDMRVIWARWESAHLIRTVISIVTFLFAVAALSGRRSVDLAFPGRDLDV